MLLPFIHHPDYSIPWPEGHRFPMAKFGLLKQVLDQRFQGKDVLWKAPQPASLDTLARVHDRTYLDAFFQGQLPAKAQRVLGLPWSEALVRRSRLEVGGTILATKLALIHGIACNTAGGTHHAFPGHGTGYCALNDLAVAVQFALDRQLARKILVLDCDVHQGDGTAFIFRQDARVFTCSIHCEKNFPGRKQQSDLDIGLDRGVSDVGYLETLDQVSSQLIQNQQPDLVFYDAGVDIHRADRLGHLTLTDEGLFQRDLLVVEACKAQNVPLVCVIGGGYDQDIGALANRHAILFLAAAKAWNGVEY